MNRLRLWFAWIFKGLGHQRLEMAWDRIEALERQATETKLLVVELATELNDLRNNLPAVLTTAPAPTVRRVGWKDFKPAATAATRAQGAHRQ